MEDHLKGFLQKVILRNSGLKRILFVVNKELALKLVKCGLAGLPASPPWQLCNQSWADSSTSMHFTFLICKVGTGVIPTSHSRGQWDNVCSVLAPAANMFKNSNVPGASETMEPHSRRLRVRVPVRGWAKGGPELGHRKWNFRGRGGEGEGRRGKSSKK